MEDFDINNTSLDQSQDNITLAFYLSNSVPESYMFVVTSVIIAISLPVTLVAIYAVFSLVSIFSQNVVDRIIDSGRKMKPRVLFPNHSDLNYRKVYKKE